MSTWPLVPLGEIFDIARGGSPRPIEKYVTDEPGGINWVTIGDASEGSKYISSTRRRIKPEGANRSRLVKPGDFLLTNSMSFGHPYIMRTTGCVHDGWLVLARKRTDIDPEFFYYLLGSKKIYSEFERRAAGVTVKNLNIDLVSGVQAPVPPIVEQRRIAAVLDRAEALRAKRRAALEDCDELAQALFVEGFGPSGRFRSCCRMASLASLCRVISDGVHKTPSYVESGIPFVTVTNIVSGELDLSRTKFIARSEFETFSPRIRPERGDVLVSKDGTIGVPCPVHTDHEFGIFVSVAVLKLQQEFVDQTFLVSQFRDRVLQDQIRAGSKGIAIRHLHLQDFERLRIVLPPLELQRDFARRVDAIEKLKAVHRASLAKLDELFASLQHRAFRGEL